MTLNDLQDDFNYFSGELTKLVRNFSFSGIAIIWLFRTTIEKDQLLFPNLLLWALLSFISALMLDFAFHIYSTILADRYFMKIERKNPILKLNEDFGDWSEWFILPKTILRWLKVSACFIGYVFILWYIIPILKFL